ncbi:hypothetical protein JOD29_000532 [Lysinibacillus composti]|uniref:Uncharacterized protein n=2 Tax=Lysinibacillus composti TaxID=720633 RepID=A0A3N9UJE0_9BACI|nr:hypothetical protein [Lysinibacillus composti]MBM7607295.1 hypothetical protein [Lysinibacillus composti]RQW76133.1 hypothetical protein EBB45_00845 [Lysinibacillus composti]
MCINNNFIEHHSYQMSEEIRKNSLYEVVRVEVSNGNSLKENEQWDSKELVSKIILEDKNKNYYVINPDQFGLRFAKGEISYKEYKQLQKKEDFKLISFSVLGIGFLTGMMYVMLKFLV